jgi:hypothetical protein
LTLGVNAVVIEQVQSYGMAVGQEVFRTVHWAGRFEEACHPIRVGHLTRPVIKAHLCHTAKAKDANVRQVLIDRFGGSEATRKGGVLYGIHRDVWAALAILVTYQDWQEGAPVRMSA